MIQPSPIDPSSDLSITPNGGDSYKEYIFTTPLFQKRRWKRESRQVGNSVRGNTGDRQGAKLLLQLIDKECDMEDGDKRRKTERSVGWPIHRRAAQIS